MNNKIIVIIGVALIALMAWFQLIAKRFKLDFKGVTIETENGNYTVVVQTIAFNPLPFIIHLKDIVIKLIDDKGNFVASSALDFIAIGKGKSVVSIPLTKIDINEVLEVAMGGRLTNYNVSLSGRVLGKKINLNFILK